MYSNRIKNISLSPTMRIAAQAITMKQKNIDLIDLSVGEPDMPTPENIKEAVCRALAANLTKYTINRGLLELRQAISDRLRQYYQVTYDVDELIVSNGAKQCLFNIIMTLVNKGDQVIIPGPYYPSYAEMVKLADGVPIHIMAREENNFKIQPDELEQSISENTKAIILCNPSNPTGAVYSRVELSALAEVVKNKDLFIISDEVYAKLIYEGTNFCSISSVNDDLREKSIVVTGVSKSYAMTGWRIGYAAGNREIIAAADKIQSHSTSNACTISQYAALEALSGPQDSVDQMRKTFEERRNFILNMLNDIRGMECVKPMGAFYVFPNISKYIKVKNSKIRLENSGDFAQFLLDKARVVVVPGSAFGSDDHIRISYSNSMENIEEGMHRISEALSDFLP